MTKAQKLIALVIIVGAAWLLLGKSRVAGVKKPKDPASGLRAFTDRVLGQLQGELVSGLKGVFTSGPVVKYVEDMFKPAGGTSPGSVADFMSMDLTPDPTATPPLEEPAFAPTPTPDPSPEFVEGYP